MEGPAAADLSGWRAVALAVVARPRLWPTALRQARRLVPRTWWRQRPFLPVPDPAWLRFRRVTAYGDPAAPLRAVDVVAWLEWSRVGAVAESARPRPSGRG